VVSALQLELGANVSPNVEAALADPPNAHRAAPKATTASILRVILDLLVLMRHLHVPHSRGSAYRG
jgi:hypothetical protein